ncbi:sucrose-specific PTS transporter subunit IIBC [Streptococcaceae bacterium ESL0729]|nr:sucrose-specific PTS transporter subunit IIBC [Streptococcaceae bacterium ESL0729]
MDYKKVAEEINLALGENNIQALAHCATRLRIVLKDPSKVDQEALDNNDDIKGTFKANGQFQIIIGPGDVNNVYDELLKVANISAATKEELKELSEGGKKNPLMDLVKVLSDIFVPMLPALVAGGLLMALNNVLTAEDLFGPQSIIERFPVLADFASIVNLLATAPFAFLPILVGFSATKRFGGNAYLGAAMGMAMVMPSLVNGYGVAEAISSGTMPYWDVFGLQVAQAGYQGSVLPIVAVAWILAKLEKFFHKKIPAAFDFTFTPMLAIIITGFLTFILVGPVMRTVSDALTNGLIWLYTTTGALGLSVFGFFYSPIVITGLHQTFPAIETTLLADIAKTGGSFIFPVASMANMAQGAAALAIAVISKNKKQKSLAGSASLSALLGITEPAIFGVNLKLKFPFICAMIAAAIGSLMLGFFKVLAVALGAASVIGFISIAPKSIPEFILSGLVTIVVAFVLTYIYGKKTMDLSVADTDEKVSEAEASVAINEDPQVEADGVSDELIAAPVSGSVIPLKDVKDPVFASEMMGKGAAIKPEAHEVYAPVSGELTIVYDSKHAYGIKSDGGSEILIHIGIDTVKMDGLGFSTNKKVGEHVVKGELLGSFDSQVIKEAGYDDTVMMIVTNTGSYAGVETLASGNIAAGEKLLSLEKTYQ